MAGREFGQLPLTEVQFSPLNSNEQNIKKDKAPLAQLDKFCLPTEEKENVFNDANTLEENIFAKTLEAVTSESCLPLEGKETVSESTIYLEDDDEGWCDRNEIVTKKTHLAYSEYARNIIDDIVHKVPELAQNKIQDSAPQLAVRKNIEYNSDSGIYYIPFMN